MRYFLGKPKKGGVGIDFPDPCCLRILAVGGPGHSGDLTPMNPSDGRVSDQGQPQEPVPLASSVTPRKLRGGRTHQESRVVIPGGGVGEHYLGKGAMLEGQALWYCKD